MSVAIIAAIAAVVSGVIGAAGGYLVQRKRSDAEADRQHNELAWSMAQAEIERNPDTPFSTAAWFVANRLAIDGPLSRSQSVDPAEAIAGTDEVIKKNCELWEGHPKIQALFRSMGEGGEGADIPDALTVFRSLAESRDTPELPPAEVRDPG